MEVEEIKNELIKKKYEMMYSLCERDDIFEPQVILNLVYNLRSIIKTLKMMGVE